MAGQKMKEVKFYNAEETTKEFYFYIGLLSTKFAIIESNILSLLGGLITNDFVLTNTILERNSLSQNIDFLKKINKYRRFEEHKIQIVIQKISAIRIQRNMFIHGLWGVPTDKDNDIVIICSEPKIVYEEQMNHRKWSSTKNHVFHLSYIKKLIEQTDIIIYELEFLAKRLEDDSDFYN